MLTGSSLNNVENFKDEHNYHIEDRIIEMLPVSLRCLQGDALKLSSLRVTTSCYQQRKFRHKLLKYLKSSDQPGDNEAAVNKKLHRLGGIEMHSS